MKENSKHIATENLYNYFILTLKYLIDVHTGSNTKVSDILMLTIIDENVVWSEWRTAHFLKGKICSVNLEKENYIEFLSELRDVENYFDNLHDFIFNRLSLVDYVYIIHEFKRLLNVNDEGELYTLLKTFLNRLYNIFSKIMAKEEDNKMMEEALKRLNLLPAVSSIRTNNLKDNIYLLANMFIRLTAAVMLTSKNRSFNFYLHMGFATEGEDFINMWRNQLNSNELHSLKITSNFDDNDDEKRIVIKWLDGFRGITERIGQRISWLYYFEDLFKKDFLYLVNNPIIQDNILFLQYDKYRTVFSIYEEIYERNKYQLYRDYDNNNITDSTMLYDAIYRKVVKDFLAKYKSNPNCEHEFEVRKSNGIYGKFRIRRANEGDIPYILFLNNPHEMNISNTPFSRKTFVTSNETEIYEGVSNDNIWVIDEFFPNKAPIMACVSILLYTLNDNFSSNNICTNYAKEWSEEHGGKVPKYIDFDSIIVNPGVKNGEYQYRGLGFQRLMIILANTIAQENNFDYVCATVSKENKSSHRNFMLCSFKVVKTVHYPFDDESKYYMDNRDCCDHGEISPYLQNYLQSQRIPKEDYLHERVAIRDFVVLPTHITSYNCSRSDTPQDKILNRILTNTEELKSGVKGTYVIAKEIKEQLTSLEYYIVHVLSSEIQNARKGLEDLFKNQYDEIIDQENKIGKFLIEISGKISENTRMIRPDALEKSEEELKKYFADAWGRFMPETCTSLKSAYTLWTSLRDIPSHEDFDYSGVVICATAALEYELRKIFFIGFQDYMDTLNLKLKKWPSRLTYINGGELIRSDPKHFSIGSMPYLFGQKSRNERENFDIDLLNEKRNDYLKTIFKENILQSEYKVKSFSDCITKNIFRNAPIPGQKIKAYHIYEEGSLLYQYEYITNKFRNKAAHAASIDDKAAEECCKMIIGKIEAKEKIENINSVLKQTFELISEEKLKKLVKTI